MPDSSYRPGDLVIFRTVKCSTRPGPRAQHVEPAPAGDLYTYEIDKFWIVLAQHPDGTLEILTRRGKRRRLPVDDERLRHAAWWERWWYRNRFPKPSEV